MAGLRRPRWPWAVLALAAAGVFVLLRSGGLSEPKAIDALPADEPRGAEDAPSQVQIAVEEPSAEIMVALPPRAGSGDPQSSATLRLQVRVVAFGSGTPLVGARVEAWETAAGEAETELPLAGLAHHAGTTDSDGRAVLDPPVVGGAVRILASAAGHRVGQARFETPPAGEIHMSLRPGLSIQGLVVDSRGEPAAGIELRGRHNDRPVALTARASEGAALLEGVEAVWTVTAPDGTFLLAGLSPGTYRVEVTEDGWVLDGTSGASAGPSRGTHPWTTYAVAKAGATALRLVAVPLRSVRLEPTDAATGARILGAPWTLEAWSLDLGARASASSYATPVAGAEDAQLPSVVLRLERAPPPGVEAEVSLVVEGYEPFRGRALLQLSGLQLSGLQLPGEEGATAAPLVRAEPVGEARLSIRFMPQGAAPAADPAQARATICRLDDHLLVRRALVRTGDGTFTCAELPAGEAEVRVWDGVSTSEPQRVTLEAGKEAQLSVEMPAPTGATVVLRDARGRRVYDADSLVFAAPGESRGMADRAAATRLVSGERRPLDLVVPLAPGTYRWAASKQGVGHATGTVTVVPGAVARIDARLDPEGLARAPAAGARPAR